MDVWAKYQIQKFGVGVLVWGRILAEIIGWAVLIYWIFRRDFPFWYPFSILVFSYIWRRLNLPIILKFGENIDNNEELKRLLYFDLVFKHTAAQTQQVEKEVPKPFSLITILRTGLKIGLASVFIFFIMVQGIKGCVYLYESWFPSAEKSLAVKLQDAKEIKLAKPEPETLKGKQYIRTDLFDLARKGDEIALKHTENLAQQGDAQAQAYLGSLHYFGLGVPTNFNLARDYFNLSAKQGNPSGQVGLGVMHRRGFAVKLNYKEAFRLFELAAQQGNPQAKFELGVLYSQGLGVEKDEQKAQVWFDQAAKEGNPEALVLLGENDLKVIEEREFCLDTESRLIVARDIADYYEDIKVINCLTQGVGCVGGEVDAVGFKWADTFDFNMCQRYLDLVDLDGNAEQDLVIQKEAWGGVSNRPFKIEILLNGNLIDSIHPYKFGIQSRYKIIDIEGDGIKEIITWSGLWDPRLPGEEGVTEETYEGHSSPHKYLFVTYKLLRGEYYPSNFYTTKKKYQPYFSWEGKEFPE